MRILIADDSIVSRHLLDATLRKWGYEVVVASDGVEAWNYLQAEDAPKLAILDETDSGLDIDALKVVANGVNTLRSPERAVVLVTHYQRLLDYIVPDFVHVLVRGRIARSGDKNLALELERQLVQTGQADFGFLSKKGTELAQIEGGGHRPLCPASATT